MAPSSKTCRKPPRIATRARSSCMIGAGITRERRRLFGTNRSHVHTFACGDSGKIVAISSEASRTPVGGNIGSRYCRLLAADRHRRTGHAPRGEGDLERTNQSEDRRASRPHCHDYWRRTSRRVPASVIDGVRCAVEVQRAMAERNVGVPTEGGIEFRIGINLGDIIVEDGDIFGDDVNIAARLEGLATGRDFDLGYCARPCRREVFLRLRGCRGTERQEHRKAGPCLCEERSGSGRDTARPGPGANGSRLHVDDGCHANKDPYSKVGRRAPGDPRR